MTPVRRLLAEFLGTGLLVTAVVGSGIAASRLSTVDAGLQLLENTLATAFALGVLIAVFSPASGAHFNPVVSLALWWTGPRTPVALRELAGYVVAQVAGAVGGALLANVMFGLPAVEVSRHVRGGYGLWLGEVVATAGLVLVILALVRTGRSRLVPVSVAAYIAAAYWFTSSTSFANPAVTVGRIFSDTFAGIAPASVPAFVAAQLVGGVFGVVLAALVYPQPNARVEASTSAIGGTS